MSVRKTAKREQAARKRSAAKRKHHQAQEVERLRGVHAKRVEKAKQAKRKLDEALAASKPTKKGAKK